MKIYPSNSWLLLFTLTLTLWIPVGYKDREKKALTLMHSIQVETITMQASRLVK